MNNSYLKQLLLLLKILPVIAKEKCFALHGGTAINIFIRDMPRLSVDIDLTYLPIEDRPTSMVGISVGLESIAAAIRRAIPGTKIIHRKDVGKLLVTDREAAAALVKVEVNLVGRGILGNVVETEICSKIQESYDTFVKMQLVPFGQLYGGKICAALDRQHPRDLFDIKFLLENEGITTEVKQGFLLCLISSDRPISELINPNFVDQIAVFANQFSGMTEEDFSYDDFEATRIKLVKIVKESLSDEDKLFLLSIKRLEPEWDIYNFSHFPAVKWKMLNLKTLRDNNLKKFQAACDALEAVLYD